MTCLAALMLAAAVAAGAEPAKEAPAKAAPAGSEPAKAAPAKKPKAPAAPVRMTVRSDSCDIDRREGVVMLDGNVDVAHSDGYGLRADRAYLFLTASNELSRVVAEGNVVITNASRMATCPLATYRRQRREVEMFGDGGGAFARLVETGAERRELEGRRIRFWLDTEQVEVDGPRITVGRTGEGVGR